MCYVFIFLRGVLYAAKQELQWNTRDIGVACFDIFTSRVELLHQVENGLNKNALTSLLTSHCPKNLELEQ